MVADKPIPFLAAERASPWTAHELQAYYLDDVLRYVSSFVHPLADAEDVVMEVFQAAFLGLHRLKRRDDPRIWLLGIARRKVANALRLRYRRAEIPLGHAEETTLDNGKEIERNALVRELLSQLPSDQREALILKYANGMSTHEVAKVLKRSDVAANSLLQRARDAFYAKGLHLFRDDQEVDHV